MTRRLRAWLDQPANTPAARRVAMTLVAVAVIAGAVAFVALSPRQVGDRAVPAVPLSPRPPVAARAPGAGQAIGAARRFLGGYLPYSYGLGAARAIHAATPRLRARLARELVRRPPAGAPTHPRVVTLTAQAVASREGMVLATVSDSTAERYPLRLTLRRDRAWRVRDVEPGAGR